MATAIKQQATDPAELSPKLIEDLKQALSLHQAEDFKGAEKLYKKALIESQHQADVALMVAIFYQQIGRHKYVITLLNKVITKNPFHAKLHHVLGKSYLADQQYENAQDALNRAQELDPNNTEIIYKKGISLHRQGQLEPALPLYQKALAQINDLIEPDQIELYHNLADLLFANKQKQQAIQYLEEALANNLADYGTLVRLVVAKGESAPGSLKHVIDAIALDPTQDEAKTLFARCCELGCFPSLASAQMKDIILACLNSQNVNHQSLAIAWFINFFLLAGKERAKELLDAANFESFSQLLSDQETKSIFFDPYFIQGLKSIRANRPNIERLLTFLRQDYLEKAQQDQTLSDDELALLGALAQQCFLNEYVFYISEPETEFVQHLKTKLENARSFTKQEFQSAALYACYAPLTSLNNHANLVKTKDVPDFLQDVITVQIKEPLAEQQYQKTIKSLGDIENQVSQSVRQQYEENPYPRWKTESFFAPHHTKAIDQRYQPKLNVLIAGCGTGKQILSTYNFYPNPSFTAIDISKASLAYAKRKLKEYNLEKHVKLYQCDILDVHKLGSSYDYIECCGVLHHMQDPLAGLKALCQQLKPGGKMKLALYSTLARDSIYQARQFIQEKGFEGNVEGIRECRKHMIDESFVDQTAFPLYQWRDFNSLSECRDLLFHVQETSYDLLEIDNLLSQAGLLFDGFFIDQSVSKVFSEQYDQTSDLKNLSKWAQFEQSYPNTFAGMYQFMAIKPQ